MTKIGIKTLTFEYSQMHGNVKIVELENGEKWKLHGECNRCGMCCEKIPAHLHPFLAKESGEGCRFLTYEKLNGENLAKCEAVFCKPGPCLIYPRDPYEGLFEECSYSWERIK